MKNHVLRPLLIVFAIIIMILLARTLLVPGDFGIHEQGYMYGWYRKSNETEWKEYRVKYKTSAVCNECHKDKYKDIRDSPHANIGCENCHGPNYDHPKDPVGLRIDRSRALCIRCHSYMPYQATTRGNIPGIIPDKHYPEAECVMCHYPHNPARPDPKHTEAEVKS